MNGRIVDIVTSFEQTLAGVEYTDWLWRRPSAYMSCPFSEAAVTKLLESHFILAGYQTRREAACSVNRFGQSGAGRIDLVVTALDGMRNVAILIEVKAHGWPSLGTRTELLDRIACVDNTQPAAQVWLDMSAQCRCKPSEVTHVATRMHLENEIVEWDISSVAQIQQRAACQIGHYMRSVVSDGFPDDASRPDACVGLTVVVIGSRVLIRALHGDYLLCETMSEWYAISLIKPSEWLPICVHHIISTVYEANINCTLFMAPNAVYAAWPPFSERIHLCNLNPCKNNILFPSNMLTPAVRESFYTTGSAANFVCVFGSTIVSGLPHFLKEKLGNNSSETACVVYSHDAYPAVSINGITVSIVRDGDAYKLDGTGVMSLDMVNQLSRAGQFPRRLSDGIERVRAGTKYSWYRYVAWQGDNVTAFPKERSVFAVGGLLCNATSVVQGNTIAADLTIGTTTIKRTIELRDICCIGPDSDSTPVEVDNHANVHLFAVLLAVQVRTDNRVFACNMDDWNIFTADPQNCLVTQRATAAEHWISPFWADNAWHTVHVNFLRMTITFASKKLGNEARINVHNAIMAVLKRRFTSSQHADNFRAKIEVDADFNIFKQLYNVIIGPPDSIDIRCTLDRLGITFEQDMDVTQTVGGMLSDLYSIASNTRQVCRSVFSSVNRARRVFDRTAESPPVFRYAPTPRRSIDNVPVAATPAFASPRASVFASPRSPGMFNTPKGSPERLNLLLDRIERFMPETSRSLQLGLVKAMFRNLTFVISTANMMIPKCTLVLFTEKNVPPGTYRVSSHSMRLPQFSVMVGSYKITLKSAHTPGNGTLEFEIQSVVMPIIGMPHNYSDTLETNDAISSKICSFSLYMQDNMEYNPISSDEKYSVNALTREQLVISLDESLVEMKTTDAVDHLTTHTSRGSVYGQLISKCNEVLNEADAVTSVIMCGDRSLVSSRYVAVCCLMDRELNVFVMETTPFKQHSVHLMDFVRVLYGAECDSITATVVYISDRFCTFLKQEGVPIQHTPNNLIINIDKQYRTAPRAAYDSV